MTELGYDASDLDARLAKIDRRLREIQEGLAPEREPTAVEPDEPGPIEMEEAADGIEPLRETAPEATEGLEEPAPEPPLAPEPPPSEPPPVTQPPPVEEPSPDPARIEEPPPEPSEQIEAAALAVPPGPPEPPEPAEPPAPAEPPEPPAPPEDLQHHRGREGPLAEILQQARREQHPGSIQDRLARQVEELTEMHAGLLSSIFDAIEGLRGALAKMPRPNPAEISVSAGPFASVEAVRAFEGLLASLPGVREVTLRGYEGEDRAVLDVELSSPNPDG